MPKNFADSKKEYNFASAIGRLAQLVQSIWFTPRGSGVRIPHRPQRKRSAKADRFCYKEVCMNLFINKLDYNKNVFIACNETFFFVRAPAERKGWAKPIPYSTNLFVKNWNKTKTGYIAKQWPVFLCKGPTGRLRDGRTKWVNPTTWQLVWAKYE